MNRLLLICMLLCTTLSVAAEGYSVASIPNVQRADATRYLSDPDGIISHDAARKIDSICGSLRGRGVAQVAVVAVDQIDGADVFDFALNLFSTWGVGSAGNSNGLGILLVRDRHEIRFVTGDGLEGVLPDAICKRIQMKYMLPYFRADDYSTGMVAGLAAVSQLLSGSELDLGGGTEQSDALPTWMIFLIVAGFIVVPLSVVMLSYYRQKRCSQCHGFTMRCMGSEIVKKENLYNVMEYTYVCSKCGYRKVKQTKDFHDDNLTGGSGGGTIIGGRGIGGFFGGGSQGGSFGGGHFGGGGAGSRW